MDGRWSSDRPDMPQRMRQLAGRMAVRTRSPRAVVVVVGLIAVVLVSAIAVSMMRTTTPGQAATAGNPVPPTAAPSSADPSPETVVTPPPSPSPSKSPSKTAKPGNGGEAPADPGDSDGGDEEAAPEKEETKAPATSTPSRPEAFGAWWASQGKYTAKWERPADDGGLAITGYVVKKCSGQTVANVGSGTFRVDIYHSSITCLTVQAINAKGAGQTAYFDGIK